MRVRALPALLLLALIGDGAAARAEDLTPSEQALLGPPAGRRLTGQELAERTHAVAALMRCPVCQGLSVADSHTLAAAAIRGKVERLLAAGYSEEQVLRAFEASYGEFIRLAPKAQGFNLLVWVAPGLMLAAGALLVARRLRRGRAAARRRDELEALRERVRREVSEPVTDPTLGSRA